MFTKPIPVTFVVATLALALMVGSLTPGLGHAIPAQKTVPYIASHDNFPNPERGLYWHRQTSSSSYTPLDYDKLRTQLQSRGISLILRVFYLDGFVNQSIDQSYLDLMKADFELLRKAGMKAIVRFAYTDSKNANDYPSIEASKVQILQHLNQLEPILVTNYDVISVVQAGFIGTWGEWWKSVEFPLDEPDLVSRLEILTKLLSVMPTERMVQVRVPQYKQRMFNTGTGAASALSALEAYGGTNIARVGHHNDCFVGPYEDMGTFLIPGDREYLAAETKYLPMGGETCELDSPHSDCANAKAELAQFHWSYLNADFNALVIDSWKTGKCLEDIKINLGYRFELSQGVYANQVVQGEEFPVSIQLRNVGWAAPFNPRVVELVLRHETTQQEWAVSLPDDPRLWLPGQNIDLTHKICTPVDMPSGKYDLFLNLPDPALSLNGRPEYSIRLANKDIWEFETGLNNLGHEITVNSSVSSASCVGALGDHLVLSHRPDLMIEDAAPNDKGLVPYSAEPWWDSPAITVNNGAPVILEDDNEVKVTVQNRGYPIPAGTTYSVCLGWSLPTTRIPFPMSPANRIECKEVTRTLVWYPWTTEETTLTWHPTAARIPEGYYCLTAWVDTLGDRVRNTESVNWDNNRAQKNVIVEKAPQPLPVKFWIHPRYPPAESSLELSIEYSDPSVAFADVQLYVPPSLDYGQLYGGEIVGVLEGDGPGMTISDSCPDICSLSAATAESSCRCVIGVSLDGEHRGTLRLDGFQIQEPVMVEIVVQPIEEFADGQFADVNVVEYGVLPGHEESEAIGGLTIRFTR